MWRKWISEWAATTRVRLKGFQILTARMLALHEATPKEYWRAKAEALSMIWAEIEAPVKESLKAKLGDAGDARLTVLHDELSECLKESEIVGFFPVAGTWGKQVAIDQRLRPSLQCLRLCSLVRHDLGPILKDCKSESQMWVPASQAEMARKRKRAASDSKGEGKGGKSKGGGKRRA